MATRGRWRTFGVTLAMTVAGAHAGSAASARPEFVLHLVDRAGVRPADLARAKATVERVFQAAGVEIQWGEGPAPAFVGGGHAAASGPRHVAVLVVNNHDESTRGATGCVLGVAVPALARASVFFNRIVETSDKGPVDLPAVLARVIAHEVGHLLLPPGSHSGYGIMRADLDLGYVNPSHFTDDQARKLRDVLVAG